MADRKSEIGANLEVLRVRVARACEQAGRSPDEVALVAVTKTYPATDLRLLADLGLTDVGENRDQEAAAKYDDCRDLDLSWHFVGQLQTNKVRSVVRYADVVHSVDRVRLVRALGARARETGRRVRCLVQVNLDPDSVRGAIGPRGGADPGEVLSVAEAIEEEQALDLGGVMAVAPPGEPAGAAFHRLNTLASRMRDRYPQATMVSAGMSGDLEAAVEHGATHLRIGAALLGERGGLVG